MTKVIDADKLKIEIPIRDKDTHKNNEWHVFMLAWSTWKTWAAILTAKWASRSWAWLVTLWASEELNLVYETNLIEEMTIPVQNDKKWRISINGYKCLKLKFNDFSSFLVGPWMWVYEKWAKIVVDLIKSVKWKPLVIDADWLNCLSEFCKQDLIIKYFNSSSNLVITPHIWEASRLFGISRDDILSNPQDVVREYSERYWIYIVLKWSTTYIWTPGWKVYSSCLWTPALSSAWTGDVLSGIIVALLNKWDIEDMILMAIRIHSMAWSIAAKKIWNEESVVASDVINHIWEAISKNI